MTTFDLDLWPAPGRWEVLAYLHGPLLVLMTANLALFLMTARCLLKSEHDTQLVRKKKTAVERSVENTDEDEVHRRGWFPEGKPQAKRLRFFFYLVLTHDTSLGSVALGTDLWYLYGHRLWYICTGGSRRDPIRLTILYIFDA